MACCWENGSPTKAVVFEPRNVTVAQDCWVGPGVVISKDTAPGELYRSPEPVIAKVSAPRFFRVKE